VAKVIDVSTRLMATFTDAQARYPELYKAWAIISHEVGSRLPNSLLSMSIQKDGSVDLLLRCMEDEQALGMARTSSGGFAVHYQKIMSDYWIGGVYETFRLLRERKLADSSPAFATILADLAIIRMALEKHELPKDWEMEAPLQMMRHPPNDDATDNYVYDPKDNQRAHIMVTSISTKGSVTWQATDPISNSARRIERRDLSDRIIALWKK
jgi:hypothetical protein